MVAATRQELFSRRQFPAVLGPVRATLRAGDEVAVDVRVDGAPGGILEYWIAPAPGAGGRCAARTEVPAGTHHLGARTLRLNPEDLPSEPNGSIGITVLLRPRWPDRGRTPWPR